MKDTPKKGEKKIKQLWPSCTDGAEEEETRPVAQFEWERDGETTPQKKEKPRPPKEEEDKKCVSLFFFFSWLLLLLMACQYHGPDSLSIRPIIQEPTRNDERTRDAHQGIVVFQQEVFLTVSK